jgi:hypothetical protein
MTIQATAVVNNPNYKSWNITCADADTSGSFAHGFASAPDVVTLTQTFSIGGTAVTSPFWSATVTATTITLNKLNSVGSGGTTPGTTVVLKVVAMLPHSIMQ